MIDFEDCFKQLPLVAILRGIHPDEVLATVESLVKAGFRLIEIPLNSPDAFTSIKLAADAFGDVAMIGAGTVLNAEDVQRTLDAKGQLIVAPNFNPAVGAAAVKAGAIWTPGVVTPTEAFAALAAGAHALKIFPAEMVLPAGIKAMRAVLPGSARVLPVGGVTPESMQVYVDAGANGFGLGSAIYRAGDTAAQTSEKAGQFVEAAKHLF
jgi:2-dehydro-3-deoxyphosphogalactonate aldolase